MTELTEPTADRSRRRQAWMALAALVAALAAAFIALRACAPGDQPPGRLAGTSEHYRAGISVERVQTGPIVAVITITRSDGRPPDVDEVAVEAAMPSMGHQNAALAAHRLDAGRFRASGELFAMPGLWELSLRITGGAGTETVTVPVTVYK